MFRMLAAVGLLTAAFLSSVSSGLAHHPGSHAMRSAGVKVRFDISVVVDETCLAIVAVETGAPGGISVPTSAAGVTVRLARRTGGACQPGVERLRREAELPLSGRPSTAILFIVGPEGTVIASERIAINPTR
jgi:hypothetical protein